MILEDLDKLIEVEKRHQREFQDTNRNVLFWEAKGAIRGFEQAKTLLKVTPMVKLIALRTLEPHICYSLKDSQWIVTFDSITDEDDDNPILGADEYLGEAIKKAITALENEGKAPPLPESLN